MPFDPKPARASRVQPSGKPDDPIRVVAISGVSDPGTLQDIARGIYEETARQEIEVSFSTSDPSSFGVDFAAANLLDLKAGQPIGIEVDARGLGEVGDAVTLLQGMTVQQRYQRLIEGGFQPKVARAYAVLIEQQNLQTVFCVQNVDIDFDREDGLEIKVEAINYVTLREEDVGAIAADPASEATRRTRGQKGATAEQLKARSQARKLAEKTAQETPPRPNLTLPQYEQLEREDFNAEYADEILAEPQTKF